MKWLYIFIGKEKNNLFNNQDVNLTGKYNFKYQGNKIDVSYKRNFCEGFFNYEDKNIDITSIVGKNGSGKTSLINHLRKIYDENKDTDKNKYETKYIVIFEKEGKVILSQKGFLETIEFNFNEITEEDKENFNIDNEINFFNEFDFIYYSNIPNDFSYENDTPKHEDRSLISRYSRYRPDDYSDFYSYFKKEEIIKLLKYFSNNCIEIKPNEKNFFNTVPINEAIIKLPYISTNSIIRGRYSEQTDEEEINFPISDIEQKFEKIIDYEKDSLKKIQIVYMFFLIVRIYEDEKTDIFSDKSFEVNGVSKYLNEMETIDDIEAFINFSIRDKKDKVNIEKELDVIEKENSKIEYSEITNIKEYTKLLESFINCKTKQNTTIFDKKTYSLKINISENNDFLKELIKLMENSKYLTSFLEIEYPNLSSGEKALFNLMAEFESVKINKTSIFIIIDELDLYFHPDLQRQLINSLISFFIKLYKEKHIHMIFTTHSPIILSDIPKENSIFLDKDDKKKEIRICTNNYTQTFAQNIHSLYKNAFFLEDTIGAFAKDTIKNVIKFLKTVEKDEIEKDEIEKISNIINSIGEPIVKRKLESLYNEFIFREKKEQYKTELDNLRKEKKLLIDMKSSEIKSTIDLIEKKIKEIESIIDNY